MGVKKIWFTVVNFINLKNKKINGNMYDCISRNWKKKIASNSYIFFKKFQVKKTLGCPYESFVIPL